MPTPIDETHIAVVDAFIELARNNQRAANAVFDFLQNAREAMNPESFYYNLYGGDWDVFAPNLIPGFDELRDASVAASAAIPDLIP